MSKFSGNTHTQHYSSALNLFFSLAASGNCKGCGFVADNMDTISLCHARRIFTKKRIDPFINIIKDETIGNLCNKFCII